MRTNGSTQQETKVLYALHKRLGKINYLQCPRSKFLWRNSREGKNRARVLFFWEEKCRSMRSHSVTVPFTNSASRRRKFLNEQREEKRGFWVKETQCVRELWEKRRGFEASAIDKLWRQNRRRFFFAPALCVLRVWWGHFNWFIRFFPSSVPTFKKQWRLWHTSWAHC